jgi:hypothetical protein
LQSGLGSIYPGERTVFIKANSSIDPDGVAPSSLLDDAKEYIQTNQATQQANEVLGCDGSSDLYVESIFNTVFYVVISGLLVSVDIESQVKTDIETALKAYFRTVEPFISGLDFIGDKNDTITNSSIATIIQDVVAAAGGSFVSLSFNTGGLPITVPYVPIPGELTKLADTGGVSYV